jgi:hypothetical protein
MTEPFRLALPDRRLREDKLARAMAHVKRTFADDARKCCDGKSLLGNSTASFTPHAPANACAGWISGSFANSDQIAGSGDSASLVDPLARVPGLGLRGRSLHTITREKWKTLGKPCRASCSAQE